MLNIAKNINKTFFGIIILLCLALAGLVYKNSRLEVTLDDTKKALTISNQETTYHRDLSGKLVATVNTITGDVNTMKLVLGEQTKEIEKRFGQLKNIQNYVQAGISASGTIYTNVRDTQIFDSIHAKKFDFSDAYLSLNCVMVGDTVSCPYVYRDSVEVVVKLQKNWKWFQFSKRVKLKRQGFDKWSPITQVVFSNPNSSATFVKSLLLK